MIKYYNINGQQTPVENAYLHVSDLSILRGYGIFDYFLAREGHPLFLDDYLNRFYRSAAELYLEIPFDKATLRQHIYDLLAANEVQEAGIRLVLTGGYSPDGYTPVSPNLLIMMYDLPTSAWEFSSQGIKIITHPFQRELPEVKTINYSTGIRMLKTVKERGAYRFDLRRTAVNGSGNRPAPIFSWCSRMIALSPQMKKSFGALRAVR